MFIDIFPIRIYKNNIDVTKLYETVKPIFEEMWEQEENDHPHLGAFIESTYRVNNQLHKLPEMLELVKTLDTMIAEYWKELNFYTGLTPCITEMWANRNQENSVVSPHNHAPYHMNGVVYLNKTSNHGNLVFENPMNLVVSLQPLNYNGTNEVQFGIEKEIELTTGDVVIFPGWLRHTTRKTVDDGRVVLAYNIGCTGDYPISNYVINR